MFKIGEFARLNWVTVKTLRYYEKIGLLLPAKVDDFTGYRFYNAEQIQVLNKILALKDVGFSLNEVSELMENDLNNDELLDIFKNRKRELKASIDNKLSKLDRVESLIKTFEMETSIMFDITIKTVESIKVASYRGIGKDYGDQEQLWAILVAYIEKHGAKILPGCFVTYHPNEDIDGVDIEVFELINMDIPSSEEVSVRDLPRVENMASIVIKGSYDLLKSANGALYKWMAENNYKPNGFEREIYFKGPWDSEREDDYVTELQVPVVKK